MMQTNNCTNSGIKIENQGYKIETFNIDEFKNILSFQLKMTWNLTYNFDQLLEICINHQHLLNENKCTTVNDKLKILTFKALITTLIRELDSENYPAEIIFEKVKKCASFYSYLPQQRYDFIFFMISSINLKSKNFSLVKNLKEIFLFNLENPEEDFQKSAELMFNLFDTPRDSSNFYDNLKILCNLLDLKNFNSSLIKYIKCCPKASFSIELLFYHKIDNCKNIDMLFTDEEIEFMKDLFNDNKIGFEQAITYLDQFRGIKFEENQLAQIFINTIIPKIKGNILPDQTLIQVLVFISHFSEEKRDKLLHPNIISLVHHSLYFLMNHISLDVVKGKKTNCIKATKNHNNFLDDSVVKAVWPVLLYIDKKNKEKDQFRERVLYFFLYNLASYSSLQNELFIESLLPMFKVFNVKAIPSSKLTNVWLINILMTLNDHAESVKSLMAFFPEVDNFDGLLLQFMQKISFFSDFFAPNVVIWFEKIGKLLEGDPKSSDMWQALLLSFFSFSFTDAETYDQLISFAEEKEIFALISDKMFFLFRKKILLQISLPARTLLFLTETFCPKGKFETRLEILKQVYKKLLSDSSMDMEALFKFIDLVEKYKCQKIYRELEPTDFKDFVLRSTNFNNFDQLSSACSMKNRFSLEIFTHFFHGIFPKLENIFFLWYKEDQVYLFLQKIRKDIIYHLSTLIFINYKNKFFQKEIMTLDAFILLGFIFSRPSLFVEKFTSGVSKHFDNLEFTNEMEILASYLSKKLKLDFESRSLAEEFFQKEFHNISTLKALLARNSK